MLVPITLQRMGFLAFALLISSSLGACHYDAVCPERFLAPDHVEKLVGLMHVLEPHMVQTSLQFRLVAQKLMQHNDIIVGDTQALLEEMVLFLHEQHDIFVNDHDVQTLFNDITLLHNSLMSEAVQDAIQTGMEPGLTRTTTMTNQLQVNTLNGQDGIIINATNPTSGNTALRFNLDGTNVFRVFKSTGQLAIDTSASSGVTTVGLTTAAGAKALVVNDKAFTIDADGNTITSGTLTTHDTITCPGVVTSNLTSNNGTVNMSTDSHTNNPVNIGTSALSGRTVTIGSHIGSSRVTIYGGTGAINLMGDATVCGNFNVSEETVLSALNTTGVVHTNDAGVLSTSQVDLTTDVTGTLPVANGGTGFATASTSIYAPVCTGSSATSALQIAATGIETSGYVLTSTGSTSLPTWQAPSGGGASTFDTDGEPADVSSEGIIYIAGGTNIVTSGFGSQVTVAFNEDLSSISFSNTTQQSISVAPQPGGSRGVGLAIQADTGGPGGPDGTTGGPLVMTAGDGGSTVEGPSGGIGGSITMSAGNGGMGSAVSGAGGSTTIAAGNGADNVSGSTGSAGNGGNIIIMSGAAGDAGGGIVGNPGAVSINTTGSGTTAIGNSSATLILQATTMGLSGNGSGGNITLTPAVGSGALGQIIIAGNSSTSGATHLVVTQTNAPTGKSNTTVTSGSSDTCGQFSCGGDSPCGINFVQSYTTPVCLLTASNQLASDYSVYITTSSTGFVVLDAYNEAPSSGAWNYYCFETSLPA